MNIFRTVCVLFLSIILLGCTKDNKSNDPQSVVLAVVGTDTINANDFRNYLAPDGSPSSEILSFKKFQTKLNEMVKNRIIASFGYANKLNENPEIILHLRTQRDELFYQKFLKNYVLSPLLSENEMRDFYEKLKTDIRVSQILIKYIQQKEITVIDQSKVNRYRQAAKALADSLYAELLKHPDSFSVLAEKLSDDENSKFLSGDIGFLRFGDTDPQFEEVAFSLRDGEISKPLETTKGFHLLKVTEHRPVQNLRSYEEAKQGIRDMLLSSVNRNKSSLVKERIAAWSDSLLKENGFKLNSKNINLYLAKYRTIQKPGDIISIFTNDELALPLAMYANGQIQILELALVMKDNNTVVKMNDALIQFGLRSVASKRIISEWLQKQGYVLTSAEKKFLQNTEQTMMQNLTFNHLNEKVAVSEEDVKKFYDNNKHQYREPGLVDIEEIWSDDLMNLNKLANEVREGANFDSVFHKAENMQGIKARRTGLIPDNAKDIIVMNASKLQPGENSEPFQNILGGYSMIKLIEKREGKDRSFEAVKNQVVMDCLNFKRQLTYNEWIANLSAQYKVQIFSDRLKDVFDIKLK